MTFLSKTSFTTTLPFSQLTHAQKFLAYKTELSSSFWSSTLAKLSCLSAHARGRLINLQVTLEESPGQKPIGLGQIKNYPCILQTIKFAEAPQVQSFPMQDHAGGLIC